MAAVDPVAVEALRVAEANYRGARRVRGLLWTLLAVLVALPLLVLLCVFVFFAR